MKIYIIRKDTRAKEDLAVRGPYLSREGAISAARIWREEYTYPAVTHLKFYMTTGPLREILM
jgi:hypothetical protein